MAPSTDICHDPLAADSERRLFQRRKERPPWIGALVLTLGLGAMIAENNWSWARIAGAIFGGTCLIIVISSLFPWIVQLHDFSLTTGFMFAEGRFFWARRIDLDRIEQRLGPILGLALFDVVAELLFAGIDWAC